MTDQNNAAQPLLTDEEIQAIWTEHGLDDEAVEDFARAIESAVLSKLRAEGVQAGDETQALIEHDRWFSEYGQRLGSFYNGLTIHTRAAWVAASKRYAALASAPVAATYVETRECAECNHVGINDSSDTQAACTQCDWSGDSPKDDHCPGCARDGTMTAACPKCGGQYRLLADRMIGKESAPVAGEAQERIEQMAVNRYRPVPDGKFSYKVVAGDGSRSLYTGTKDSCLRVAAKLTEAFLDGAFVASDASPQSSKDGEHGE